MIRTALEFIKKELDAYVASRENDPANYTPGSIVDIKALISPNGNINIDGNTHITIMVASIEEEKREGKRPYIIPSDHNTFSKRNPPIEINLFLLLVANSSDYPTALRDLSDIIGFFQSNVVFTEQSYPGLNASVTDPEAKPWQLIDRLTFRIHNFSFEQQNNLWGMFGGKYIPSIVYKMNLLTAFDQKSKDDTPAITQLGVLENN